ncbi:MAG: TAXI family TRAP transporter solute-binding subunit [Rhizobiales bacterium]|nr:TAXI family TRAP transporter solute-binding subunit [Hyphomicrobiales bacterium]
MHTTNCVNVAAYARRQVIWNLRITAAVLVALGLASASAAAQTVGFATLPPGTLNHTTASAIAKVMKDKAGMNMLVQPTAGDTVILPMVNRGEAEIGIANAVELHNALAGEGPGGKLTDIRIIATAHPLKTAFWVRKDSPMQTIADLKGKRVVMGYSAMRVIDTLTRAMLAAGGLTEKDVKPVLVPNVVRGADDFVSGAADMYFFAFGGPKVREVDATVGGTRVLTIDPNGMPTARSVSRWGYLTGAEPGPIFVGVTKPMQVYTFDNVIFTNAKVKDDLVYKLLDTMEKSKADLIAVQPVLRAFSAKDGYKQYEVPYHPGALRYFKERGYQPVALQ